tara:strand:- start:325 stop:489 length:165 start_codon:yes stop_codon:yes gene_type:complete
MLYAVIGLLPYHAINPFFIVNIERKICYETTHNATRLFTPYITISFDWRMQPAK